ncbi:MAG: hypothetical protein J4F36_06580 [Nitrosopumilaceae archaeon]|nr:hypothetical protein [Nitrosopumilaceae archaeon]
MIQIYFNIEINNFKQTKKIQFCKSHEKDFDILYKIAKDSIIQRKKQGLDQLIIVCGFYVVNEIRKKSPVEKIKNNLTKEFSRHYSIIHMLKDTKKFSIEAKIDDFPKKILSFSSKDRDFIPIPIEQQIWKLT